MKGPRISDLRGVAQLSTDAVEGVARIAEGVHQSVWQTLGFEGGEEPGRARGVTGLVYRSIHGIAQLLGKGVDTALARLEPLLESSDDGEGGSPDRAAALAALNGVMGDRLVESQNPLATPMTLRYQGRALDLQALPPMPEASAKVLLLVHGLCMNDLQWRREHEGQVTDHREALASALGHTPLHLRYNSGLHVWKNGRELAALLERLVASWPTPIEDLTVVAHSMGGLLIRSACHYARAESSSWPGLLKNIAFLGTPHHGAPLERAGYRLDLLLGSTPYTAPFTRLAGLRSAGITDLRFGHVLEEDPPGPDRSDDHPDGPPFLPLPLPLPDGVACFAVAATTTAERGILANHLIGDGLVPLPSALGRHHDERRNLQFPSSSQCIAYRTNHLELLSSPEVTRQLIRWLRPAQVPAEKGDAAP